MADNKKTTELTQVNVAISGDLVYLVTSDEDGVSSSVAITKDNFLKSTVTGVNRLISGQVVWTGTGFTHRSVQLSYEIEGIIYFLNGTTITNDAPDGSNPRFDVIFVDASGLGIKKGTPAGSPTVPSLDNPDTEIATNIVLVTNGETTPTGVVLETLYSENLQESGGEWDTDSSSTAVRIDLESTTDPINLTVDIRSNGVIADDFFSLFNTTAVAIADFQNLRHTFRSLENWKKDYLRLSFLDGATEVGFAYITKDSFDTTDLVTDQDVYINKDMVSWVSGENEFDKIVYLWVDAGGASPVSTARFQVDLIKIETGGITTSSFAGIDGGDAFTVF